MHADRIVVKTDSRGRIKGLPTFAPNHRFEVVIREIGPTVSQPVRRPDPAVAGKLHVFGDVFSTVGDGDWNLPR